MDSLLRADDTRREQGEAEMTLAAAAEPLPLKADQDGVWRVGGTRVSLDTVVGAYGAGLSPEEIVLRYDVLRLEDVYLVFGYYLRHKADVDAYVAERRRRGDEAQAEAEKNVAWSSVRRRLLARRGSGGAAAGGG
jgi:uncharacterized protein (DUF433 family)